MIAPTARRPNVVVVIADDLGVGDAGSYHPASKVPTPNLDRLAAEGVRFTDAHAASAVCTPSRYALLTGEYGWRTRLQRGVLTGYAPAAHRSRRADPAAPAAGVRLRDRLHRQVAPGDGFLGPRGRRPRLRDGVLQRPRLRGAGRLRRAARGWTVRRRVRPLLRHGRVPHLPRAVRLHRGRPLRRCRPRSTTTIPSTRVVRAGWRRGGRTATSTRSFADRAVAWIEARADHDEPFFLYLAASAPHEPCTDDLVPAFARGRSQAGPRGDLAWLYDWLVGQRDGRARAHRASGRHAAHRDERPRGATRRPRARPGRARSSSTGTGKRRTAPTATTRRVDGAAPRATSGRADIGCRCGSASLEG